MRVPVGLCLCVYHKPVRLTEIADENGSDTTCRSVEMRRRVVENAYRRGVLVVRHSDLLGHQLGIDLVVDLAYLGQSHQRHGVGVDAEHQSLLGHVQTARAVQQLICTQQQRHPFIGPLSATTWASWYQKGKTKLDFTEARVSEWQRHQLGHIKVCTSLQTEYHNMQFFSDQMPFPPPKQNPVLEPLDFGCRLLIGYEAI